ncbi:restriction endonuclease subunit S [Paraburkholderia phosphatilytica]|uniref:restriction endonuclease subunit S n=1 Tax=Paraburkholderia phosphatilytica TaxID=2282883 RepID=UPI000E48932C|nr:restriction endonuclease subunit S [Paraburkholderia phosphatilytica]
MQSLVVALGDVAALNPRIGKSLPLPNELVDFLPMAGIDAEASVAIPGEAYPYFEVQKGYTNFVDGDVLVAKITPCFENGKIAQVKLRQKFGFGSTEFHVIRPNAEKLDARYLAHFLRTKEVLLEGEKRMTGSAGQRRVPRTFLESLSIRIPPLAQQRRIAAILDKADELRAKRKEVLALLDSMAQSIFVDMFGDPATNSGRWLKKSLIDLCAKADDIRCGPFGTQLSASEFREEGVPLWGIRNVNAKFERPTVEFLTPETAKRLAQYSIEPRDIVMTRKGTIGNCAVYPEHFESGVMHSDLLRIRVDPKKCLPEFIAHQLHHSRDVERQISMVSSGAVMPGINVTKLKGLEIQVPELELQKRFQERVTQLGSVIELHNEARKEADNLFSSLQAKAFWGQCN